MDLLPNQISLVTRGMLVFSTPQPGREWACVYMYPVSSSRWIQGRQTFAVQPVRSWCCSNGILCATQQQWNAEPSEVREAMCQCARPANSMERGILTEDKSLFPLQNVVYQWGSHYLKGHPGDGLPETRSSPQLCVAASHLGYARWSVSAFTTIRTCAVHESRLGTSSHVPTQPIPPGFSHTYTSQPSCPWLAASTACLRAASESGRCSCQREALVRLSLV